MSDRIVSAAAAFDLVADALARSRTSRSNAESVARGLVAAELAGQGGHGLRRVPAYAAQARAGKVDGMAEPEIALVRAGALRVDARNGFAFRAIEAAFAPLAEAARRQGIAVAGICRSHHCGVAGTIVERYAEAGLVALLFANTPAAMAPWGGSRRILGTNPIAFAAPVRNADPIVVDAALSAVARGKIMAAAQAGEPIPEGWAFDPEGRPTTDAADALAGSLAPLGGAKGVALALMVELLAAGLTGSNYAFQASSFFDDKGPPPGVGQLILAVDPNVFFDDADRRFEELAREFEAQAGTRLPGRRRQELQRRLRKDGISLPESLIAAIEKIGG